MSDQLSKVITTLADVESQLLRARAERLEREALDSERNAWNNGYDVDDDGDDSYDDDSDDDY